MAPRTMSRRDPIALLVVLCMFGCVVLSAEPVDNKTVARSVPIQPSAEPYNVGSPEPESEWTAEPSSEPETTAESYPEDEPFAEPEPDWPVAKQEWGVAWEIHIYAFGVLFGILAIYSVISIIRLYPRRQLLSRRFFLTLNSLIFLLSSLRSVYLLVDAYNSKKTFPAFVSYLLYNIPMPCLTSVFSLLFFALLQTVRMTFISTKIQKLQYLVGIILFHFCLSIVTDFVVGLLSTAEILLFVCQAMFVAWGLFLFCSFLVLFRHLYQFAKRRQSEDDKLNQSYKSHSLNNSGTQHHSRRYTMSLAIVATLITSIFGLIIVALELYAMFGLYALGTGQPQPWQYWGFMTAFRSVEICMCILMSYVATQPFRYNTATRNCFFCVSCTRCCSRDSDVVDGSDDSCYPSVNDGTVKSNHVNEDTVPLCAVTYEKSDQFGSTPKSDSPLVTDNGCVNFHKHLDIDSIRFIDDDSTRSINSIDSSCAVTAVETTKPEYTDEKYSETEKPDNIANGVDQPHRPYSEPNGDLTEKPVATVSPFENNLAEQVRPRGRLNRTPALDDNSTWNPDISKSGEIPRRGMADGEHSNVTDLRPNSEAEDVPRVKYRLKQRHPLMQRSSSEGGPLPATGHLGYVSSSDSDGDVPPVDREELAKSTDLSEFNKDVQDAMASLIDDSSQEFIEMEADV